MLHGMQKMTEVDCDNRTFDEEWTDCYMFILGSSKPLCPMCSDAVGIMKSSTVKCHYEVHTRNVRAGIQDECNRRLRRARGDGKKEKRRC